MKNKVINRILIILSIILLILFIWFKFIRKKLPKEIPLILTIFGFFTLLGLCVIYLYLIYKTFNKQTKITVYHKILHHCVELLFKPFEQLDLSIKNLLFKDKDFIYKKLIFNLCNNLEYYIIQTNYYYIFFLIVPRCFLLSILLFDISFFEELFLIYKVVIVSIIFLINKYILYCLKTMKESLIIELETLLDDGHITIDFIYEIYEIIHTIDKETNPEYNEDDWPEEYPPTLSVDLRLFIDYKIKNSDLHFMYLLHSSEKYNMEFRKKNNISKKELDNNYVKYSKQINKELEEKLYNILKISNILYKYTLTHQNHTIIKKIKVYIYLNYFLCWSSIFIISLPSLNIYDVISMLNTTWEYTKEPFTDVFI